MAGEELFFRAIGYVLEGMVKIGLPILNIVADVFQAASILPDRSKSYQVKEDPPEYNDPTNINNVLPTGPSTNIYDEVLESAKKAQETENDEEQEEINDSMVEMEFDAPEIQTNAPDEVDQEVNEKTINESEIDLEFPQEESKQTYNPSVEIPGKKTVEEASKINMELKAAEFQINMKIKEAEIRLKQETGERPKPEMESNSSEREFYMKMKATQREIEERQKAPGNTISYDAIAGPKIEAKQDIPKAEGPTNEELRAKKIAEVEANFERQPDLTIIKSDGKKITRTFDNSEDVTLISKEELKNKIAKENPKVEEPTNEELRTKRIAEAHANFEQQATLTVINTNGQKLTRTFEDDEPIKLMSREALLSKLTVTPPDPEKAFTGGRMGMMNDMKKTEVILKALTEKFPEQSWSKGNDGASHDAQFSNSGGKSSFDVKNDSMVTKDDSVETFKAMLVGFQAAYKNTKPTITANPELETKWREAAQKVGVEINFKPAQPEVAKTQAKTAEGPAQTKSNDEVQPTGLRR